MVPTVMTVRGAVPASDLGFVLPHEHLLLDAVKVFPANLLAYDFQLLDEGLAMEELGAFLTAASRLDLAPGTPTLVDVTTDERLGRDPSALCRLADALDMHIVMGCGRYREPWYEPDIGRLRGTNFIRLVTGFVFALTPGGPMVGFLVFGFMAFIGMVFFWRAFKLAFPKLEDLRYLQWLMLMPSLAFRLAWLMLRMLARNVSDTPRPAASSAARVIRKPEDSRSTDRVSELVLLVKFRWAAKDAMLVFTTSDMEPSSY